MNKEHNLSARGFIVLFIILFTSNLSAQSTLSIKDLTVLKEPASLMMQEYLTNVVERQFIVRDSLLSMLHSSEDWELRSKTIRDSMVSWVGSFPVRTPLNSRITDRLDRGDYVIEKIIFESRQNFLVSANLYLPKNFPFPRPAILNVTGHENSGKANEKTQLICIAQAKKGFVSLAIDGLGQGERKIYDVKVGIAHQIIGTQAFISGTHVFNFMVWDAIRAIDYLVSRKEVDAQKIGITGSSGGGMMSTYILPFEDRIAVSIPACNPNTWNYRARANLATDHEQIFFGAFASSIDPRGDPLFAQVPKPLLINATADDELNPPRGVWDLSSWLYKSYAAHGVPEKFYTSMVKAAHEYNLEQREISYAWMLRWMGGDPGNFLEENVTIEKAEDLWATETGNVYNEDDSRHPHELVLDYLSEYQFEEKTLKYKAELEIHKTEMANSIESVLNTNFDNIAVVGKIGEVRLARDISIRTFVLEPETGIVLPGVLLEAKAQRAKKDVILYINQRGKSEILKDWNLIEELLHEGYRICAVDLRGTGETSPDLKDKFWDFLAGKPIFGQRVQDVLATTKWLKESEVKANKIKLWATGTSALYGAFSGVLSDDITTFILDEPLLSFENVVQINVPKYRNEVMLPGILEKFDMPQVYQALCPGLVVVLNPQLADLTFASESDLKKIDKLVSTTFKTMKIKNAWQIDIVDEKEREKMIIKSLMDD